MAHRHCRMWWRPPSMLVLTILLLNAPRTLGASSLEAVFTPGGEVLEVGDNTHKNRLMRRHEFLHDKDGAEQLQNSPAELVEKVRSEKQYGVRDKADRGLKMKRGTAFSAQKDPWAISTGKHTNDDEEFSNWHEAPVWRPHAQMPEMPICIQDVDQDMGVSDYGRIQHGCSSCVENCTKDNRQEATNLTWTIEPPLDICNAFDLKLFVNWSNIDQLGCSSCGGKGLRHAFEFEIASNAGEGVNGTADTGPHPELSFHGWMGPEVAGGPRGGGSDFAGLHVFEIEDTMEPSHSDDCSDKNPSGRWIAIPGQFTHSPIPDTFRCERICKSSHPCQCGRHTTTRCTAPISMNTGSLFAYRIHVSAAPAEASLDGLTFMGTEWEVTAEDLTQTSPVLTVGRIILEGNSNLYGIKALKQSHQHLGCVECDLFYESTIVTGPFIENPPGVHIIRQATGFPPPLTSESCELFRISSVDGYAVKFETGAGLWPPFEVNDTIFRCRTFVKTNECPIEHEGGPG